MGVKRNPIIGTPDNTGSRAASTAQSIHDPRRPWFAGILREYRRRHSLTREDAARLFLVTPRTLENWEQQRCLPQGVSFPTIVDHIFHGGAL